MKRFLFIATMLVAGVFVNGQTIEEETKQLEELIATAKSKTDTSEKAKAVVDIMVFGAKAKNKEIHQKAKDAVADINNYKLIDEIAKANNVVLSKPISDLSKEDLKEYRIEEDKFRSITFLTPKVSMTSKYAYLSVKESVLKFHLVMEYYGSGWIFWDKAILLYNGKKFEYFDNNTNRSVSSGANVTETSDVVADEKMLEALREIVNTEKVEVRLSGKYVSDFEMSDRTKKSIKLALELYDKLKK